MTAVPKPAIVAAVAILVFGLASAVFVLAVTGPGPERTRAERPRRAPAEAHIRPVTPPPRAAPPGGPAALAAPRVAPPGHAAPERASEPPEDRPYDPASAAPLAAPPAAGPSDVAEAPPPGTAEPPPAAAEQRE